MAKTSPKTLNSGGGETAPSVLDHAFPERLMKFMREGQKILKQCETQLLIQTMASIHGVVPKRLPENENIVASKYSASRPVSVQVESRKSRAG
jgi:hypothetical protein